MDRPAFESTNGKIKIGELPEGITDIKELPDHDALVCHLQNFVLAKLDMEKSLDFLNNITDKNTDIVNSALFEAALVTFYKNFSFSKSRAPLDEKLIFQGKPKAIACFQSYKALRNKHIVHDENDYSQAHIVAMIINDGKSPVVSDITAHVIIAELFETHSPALVSLISDTRLWLAEKIVDLGEEIKANCNNHQYGDLSSLPSVEYLFPTKESVNHKRTHSSH